MELDLMHVVVIEFGPNIENLSVLDGNIGKD